MSHEWSGWPGAFCLKCGAEDALENALAMGWLRIDETGNHFTHPTYKKMVNLCNGNCAADMSKEQFQKVKDEADELQKEILKVNNYFKHVYEVENREDVKQVIVVRKDLNMRRGKEIAQGAHASMKFIVDGLREHRDFREAEKQWLFNGSFKKICLIVESEQELIDIYEKAKDEYGLIANMIIDSGLTEFGGELTKTAVAIGPDYSEIIDKVTGKLRLY